MCAVCVFLCKDANKVKSCSVTAGTFTNKATSTHCTDPGRLGSSDGKLRLSQSSTLLPSSLSLLLQPALAAQLELGDQGTIGPPPRRLPRGTSSLHTQKDFGISFTIPTTTTTRKFPVKLSLSIFHRTVDSLAIHRRGRLQLYTTDIEDDLLAHVLLIHLGLQDILTPVRLPNGQWLRDGIHSLESTQAYARQLSFCHQDF